MPVARTIPDLAAGLVGSSIIEVQCHRCGASASPNQADLEDALRNIFHPSYMEPDEFVMLIGHYVDQAGSEVRQLLGLALDAEQARRQLRESVNGT